MDGRESVQSITDIVMGNYSPIAPSCGVLNQQLVRERLTYNGVKLPDVHGVPQNVKTNQSNLKKQQKSSKSIKLCNMNTVWLMEKCFYNRNHNWSKHKSFPTSQISNVHTHVQYKLVRRHVSVLQVESRSNVRRCKSRVYYPIPVQPFNVELLNISCNNIKTCFWISERHV